VLLTTVLLDNQKKSSNPNKKILYVLDGKIITFREYENLEKNKIIGIGTITDKDAIKEFSTDYYDELIYVSTKMPTE